jgi:hypothetical protein
MSISATEKWRKKRREDEQTSGAVLVSDHWTATVITGNTIQQINEEGVRVDKDREERTFMTDGAEEVHGEVFLEAALLHRWAGQERCCGRCVEGPFRFWQPAGQREKVIEDRRRKAEREELSLPRSQGRLKGLPRGGDHCYQRMPGLSMLRDRIIT